MVGLQRGERRAARIRAARASGQPLPKRRYYSRTGQWRAAQELKLEAKKRTEKENQQKHASTFVKGHKREGKAKLLQRSASDAGAEQAAAAADMTESGATGGWNEVFDDAGNAYYHNVRTGATQWDKPAELGGGTAPTVEPQV